MAAEPAAMGEEKEFHFTDKDFSQIRSFVKQKTGINLSEGKRTMIYSRLVRRLRQLDLRKFSDYLAIVRDDNSGELVNFINAVTTNLTAFFREPHHFEYLKKTVIPRLLEKNATTRRMRIWSAGCSTGEEPYSLAMTLLSSISDIDSWDVKLLATDLDTNVLQHASNGVYEQQRVEGIDSGLLRRYFLKGRGEHVGSMRVADRVRQLITFKQLNLMEAWPMKGPFDFIFCRNVVIYFDKDTQRQLVSRYADLTAADGHLFLGHSESLFKVSDRYKLIGQTIYQKVK